MTLEEAIRYNGATLGDMERQLLHHRASASRLGIEALKRVQDARDFGDSVCGDLLPGETKK